MSLLTGCSNGGSITAASADICTKLHEPPAQTTASPSVQTEDCFQQAISQGYEIIENFPDKIRVDLRGRRGNTDEAIRLYSLAAEQDHRIALNNLANILANNPYAYPKEILKAHTLYRRLAKLGDYRGYLGLGGTFLTSFPGQASDEGLGTACIETAATVAESKDIAPSIALASLDLNTQRALMQAPPKPQLAGLPPAPTAPLDITEYLQNFHMRHPDL